MEHWAGVMAWEVRRLEYAVKAADDRALRAAHDAEELAQLREERRKAEILEQELGETRRLLEKGGNIIKQKEEEASLLKSELNSRDLKMSDLETALSELEGEVKTKRKEGALLEAEAGQHRTRASELENMLRGAEQHAVRVQEVERELSEIRLERETWAEEKSRLASAAEDSKMRANMWETAKIGTAQALGVQQVANIAEIVDGIKKLTVTVQHRDEELKVLKDEMREISVGFENEIGRIAKERDGYRAQLDDLGGRALNDETVRAKQTEELHSRLQVSGMSRSFADHLKCLSCRVP
jgi:chromosome segregation ATPase